MILGVTAIRAVRLGAIATVGAAILLASTPASASGATFKRFNSPITAAQTLFSNVGSCSGILFLGSSFYADCGGTTYEFASSGGNGDQPKRQARTGLAGLAYSDGAVYATGGGLWRLDLQTLKPTRIADVGSLGIVADPLSTDLYVVSGGIYRVSNPKSSKPSVKLLVDGGFDGLSVTADGERFYAAGGGSIWAFDRNGKQLFKADLSTHSPDGVAVAAPGTQSGGLDLSQNVFVNSNDGTIERIDINDHNKVSVVASGGTRGDFMIAGPDSCLYATQSATIEKLAPCIFDPTGTSLPDFTRSLRRLADVLSPQTLIKTGPLALLILLLTSFGKEIFDGAVRENYDEVSKWRLTRWIRWLAAGFSRFARWFRERPPAGQFVAFTVMGAILYSLLEPQFWDQPERQLEVVAGFLAALPAVVYVYALPARRYMRSRGGGLDSLRYFPAVLPIAAACVAISRWIQFAPGFAYGLFAGVAFSRERTTEEEGKSTLLSALGLFLVALLAWIVRDASPLKTWADTTHSQVLAAVVTALVSFVVLSVEFLAFGFMPMRFLDGEKVSNWNPWAARAAWFVFAVVLLGAIYDPGLNILQPNNPSGLLLCGALGLFLVAVGVWGFLRLRPSRAGSRLAQDRSVTP